MARTATGATPYASHHGLSPVRLVDALGSGAVLLVSLVVIAASVRGAAGLLLLLVLVLAATALVLLFGGAHTVQVSALVAVVCLITTRPNILGEAFALAGSIGWLAVAAMSRHWWRNPKTVPFLAAVGITLAAYWFYIVLLDTVRAPSLEAIVSAGADTLGALAVPSTIAGAAAVLGGWAVGTDPRQGPLLVKMLVVLCGWQVVGYAVLLPLWRAAGTAAGTVLTLDPAAFGGREQEFAVYVTGIVTTGRNGFAAEIGPRLTGWGGEPGIFGATLLLVAFFASVTPGVSRRWSVAAWLIAAPGLLFVQSTAALLTAAISGLVALVTVPRTRVGRWRGLGLACLGGLGFAALLLSPLGLRGKGEQNSVSVTDRLNGVGSPAELFTTWLHAPFGGPVRDAGSVGVNLVQESLRYGLPVALLASLVFVLPAVATGSRRRLAPGIVMLLTMVWFAQPGLANPLWLCFMAIAAGVVASQTQEEAVPAPVLRAPVPAVGLGRR